MSTLEPKLPIEDPGSLIEDPAGNLEQSVENPSSETDDDAQPQNNSQISSNQELNTSIEQATLRVRKAKSETRVILGISVLTFIFFLYFLFSATSDVNSSAFTIAGSVVMGAAAFIFLIAWLGSNLGLSKAQDELLVLEVRKRIDFQFSKNNSGSSHYFETLVQINVDNLGEYYSLIKRHTNNSFIMSALASIIGFIVIITGLVIGFLASPENSYLPSLVTGFWRYS